MRKGKLYKKAMDKGTLGSVDKAWRDRKKKEYRLPKPQTGGK